VPTKPPIQWILGVHSLGVKWSACEVDHSPLSNAEVKNESSYTSATLHVLHGRDSFTFLPLTKIRTMTVKNMFMYVL